MNKIECKKLFEEYKEIKSKINKSTQLYTNINLTANPPINPALPSNDTIKRFNKIVMILKNNCKEYIDPESYLEIEKDSIL